MQVAPLYCSPTWLEAPQSWETETDKSSMSKIHTKKRKKRRKKEEKKEVDDTSQSYTEVLCLVGSTSFIFLRG